MANSFNGSRREATVWLDHETVSEQVNCRRELTPFGSGWMTS